VFAAAMENGHAGNYERCSKTANILADSSSFSRK